MGCCDVVANITPPSPGRHPLPKSSFTLAKAQRLPIPTPICRFRRWTLRIHYRNRSRCRSARSVPTCKSPSEPRTVGNLGAARSATLTCRPRRSTPSRLTCPSRCARSQQSRSWVHSMTRCRCRCVRPPTIAWSARSLRRPEPRSFRLSQRPMESPPHRRASSHRRVYHRCCRLGRPFNHQRRRRRSRCPTLRDRPRPSPAHSHRRNRPIRDPSHWRASAPIGPQPRPSRLCCQSIPLRLSSWLLATQSLLPHLQSNIRRRLHGQRRIHRRIYPRIPLKWVDWLPALAAPRVPSRSA